MGKPEAAVQPSTEERVLPIFDSVDNNRAEETGAVKRRPFVLERKPGGGRGNMALMLGAVGVVLILGVAMIALLSTKGTAKHRTAAEAAKPKLGRYAPPAPTGDLVPEDKMKPSPADIKEAGSIEASDIEHTKSAKPAQAQSATQSGTQPKTSIGDFRANALIEPI